MKILLVHPLLSKTDFETPLGILYIASALKDSGYDADVADLVFNFDIEYFVRSGFAVDYDIYAMSVMSTSFPAALKLADHIKSINKKAVVVMGGPHPTLFPKEVLKNESIDIAVIGEGENTFVELLQCLERKEDLAIVRGLAWKKADNIIINEKRAALNNLDLLSFPARNKLATVEGYVNLAGIKVLFGKRSLNLIASRGCAYNCDFCQPVLRSIHGAQVRYRSPANIVSELKELKRLYNIDAVWFEDDTFTYNKGWLYKLCELLQTEKTGLVWSCNSRVDTVDQEMLSLMKAAGCVQIRYGVEFGTENMLNDEMNKGTSLQEIQEAFDMTKKEKIKTYAYVMIGGIHETKESAYKTRDLLRILKPTHVQIAITTPLPGTGLADKLAAEPSVNIISNALEDIDEFQNCLFDTRHLSHEETEKIYRDIYEEFHFFSLQEITNAKLKFWIKRNLDFLFFRFKTARGFIIFTTLRILTAYFILAVRYLLIQIPGLKKIQSYLFKKRLSFPPF